MSFSYNRVMLAGNLTRDPEVRFLANETAVANFGIAINRKFKDKEGKLKEEVTFVDVEAWGRTAELAGQYLTKGNGCFIEGRLKLDQWTEADGSKRSKLKVNADSVQFTSPASRPDSGNEDIAVSAAHSEPAPRRAPPAGRTAPGIVDEPPL